MPLALHHPLPPQGHRGGSRTCVYFVSCRESCMLSSRIKALCKVTACPSSRAHETTFQEPVYRVAESVLGSQPSAETSLSILPVKSMPFLSSWRRASHPHRLPRLVAGAGLWNSKAQKVQRGASRGLAFLCLNLTTNHSPAFQLSGAPPYRGLVDEGRKNQRSVGTALRNQKPDQSRKLSGILACWALVL